MAIIGISPTVDVILKSPFTSFSCPIRTGFTRERAITLQVIPLPIRSLVPRSPAESSPSLSPLEKTLARPELRGDGRHGSQYRSTGTTVWCNFE
jgi:hypothetical protein